ncbi:MAG: NAD(P)H-hydrate dehydratase [Halofilum sp. (in: g-proteobacteria)]
MSELAGMLYTAAQVRELDRRAIEDLRVGAGGDAEAAGYTLMRRAGAAAFRLLRLRWPGARSVAVFCGGGNNGGDGLVVASLARAAGYRVRVALAREPAQLQGAAAKAWADWAAAGGDYVGLDALAPGEVDVVVDGLLGTGLDRPVSGAVGDAVARINAAPVPVLALDIPSGLQADTGAVLGDAVAAEATMMFIGAKRGLYTGAAPDYTGPVFLDRLEVADAVYEDVGETVQAVNRAWSAGRLPRRRLTTHKGQNGHVLIVGGDYGFAGAARMAGEAALRCGAGRVTVATRPEHASALALARPELMTRGMVEPERELPVLIDSADVVVAGPGLGRGEWSRAALAAVRAGGCRRQVLDADALTVLAEQPEPIGPETVLTPHPGEAGRLAGVSPTEIQQDRFAALAALVQRYDAAVVLKGPGTLVGAPGGPVRMIAGARPAMAVGGMGDVLSGVIAALLGQGLAPPEAGAVGAWLHAAAADRCAEATGVSGVMPSDLLSALAPTVRATLND